jgi:hypothetical protein
MHVSKDIGSNERMAMQICRFLMKVLLFPNGSSHPASQIKTDLPPATQILCWLLPSLQKHKNNKLMYYRGVGSSKWQGAIEGDWEHLSSTASHQQSSHQPQTAPT